MEAWLRPLALDLDPVNGHLIRAALHIREDLREALSALEPSEIWAKPLGMTSAGFHAKHLAGSTERLCAYLEDRSLSTGEVAAIDREGVGEEDAAHLTQLVDAAFHHYEHLIRALKPEDYGTLRYVGRARLPVTAAALAIHIAEHGQRHVGQTISAARLAKALRNA